MPNRFPALVDLLKFLNPRNNNRALNKITNMNFLTNNKAG